MAVYFKEDADRNVSLTRAESKDADGDLYKTTVVVKVPNNVIAGDVVTVKIDNGTSPETKKYNVISEEDILDIVNGRQTKTSLAALAAETVAHELRNRGILEINRKTQRVYTVHSPHAPNRLAEIASYEIC